MRAWVCRRNDQGHGLCIGNGLGSCDCGSAGLWQLEWVHVQDCEGKSGVFKKWWGVALLLNPWRQ